MKKAIIIILALAILVAGGGTLIYMQSQKPEKQILGQWEGSYEIGSFNFKEDGVVTIGFASLSSDGTYTLDSELSELSITYSLLGISYTKDYSFVLEDDVLTLTSKTFEIEYVYNRVAE